jgi:RNA polymerase sigma-70 factor (ECF subfamily)
VADEGAATPGLDDLVRLARGGDDTALGQLLELYRDYLRLVARSLIGPALRTRVAPSDLVQETFLEAHRDFGQFEGASECDLLAWLRKILVRNLTDQARRHRSMGRDLRREESLEALMERSDRPLQWALASTTSPPSEQASRREQDVLLADALARLPADYREVILLRNMDRLPFQEVAAKMRRSSGAVRMLWVRALERLNRELEELR